MNRLTVEYVGGGRERFESEDEIKLEFQSFLEKVVVHCGEFKTELAWKFVKLVSSDGQVTLL